MKDLVSIITPCYNSAEFIEETIQSVLNQTYENWEWLITDDLSKDNTVEIIRKYNDPRIKLQVLEKTEAQEMQETTALERAQEDTLPFWIPMITGIPNIWK